MAALAVAAAMAVQVLALASTAAAAPGIADVSVTITGPAEVAPGDEADYAIVITNAGPDAASDVAFDLSAPVAGTSYVVDGTGFTCNPSWHCVLTAPLASGQALGATLTLGTNPTADHGDAVETTVTVATSATDPDAAAPDTDNEFSFVTTMSTDSNLSLSVERVGTGAVLPGSNVTYRVRLENDGPAEALDPAVRAARPASTSIVSVVASNSGVCSTLSSSGAKECSWGNLPVGQHRDVTLTLKTSVFFAQGDRIWLNAAAIADNSAAAAEDVRATTITDTHARPTDVAVTTWTQQKVRAGKKADWKVTIVNRGPYRAHGVVLKVLAPKGFRWGKDNGRSSRTDTIRIGNLDVGDGYRVNGWFVYPAKGSLTWSARATHTDPDGRRGNDLDRSTSKVLAPVVSVTSTAGSTTSADTTSSTPVVSAASEDEGTPAEETIYDDAGRPISGPGSESANDANGRNLGETGGPARASVWLGFAFAVSGVCAMVGARPRRIPRHRAPRLAW